MAGLSLRDRRGFAKAPCYLCGSRGTELIEALKEKPVGETAFGIAPGEYYREIRRCPACGVYNNLHGYDFEDIYTGKYAVDTYNRDIIGRYNFIMNLLPEKSNNKQRVERITRFCALRGIPAAGTKVLDVGSGLCVFLAEMMRRGFRAFCVDPDADAAAHAHDNVKVEKAFRGDFAHFESREKFDIIAFNKVLEHMRDPVIALKKAGAYLENEGFVYLEVPDGESALKGNRLREREEFYIEHYMVFSDKSVRLLARECGFAVEEIKEIYECTDKYTIYAFLVPLGKARQVEV